MNLAGVEKVFELEQALERMQRKVGAARAPRRRAQGEIERLEEVKREVKAEIVRYEARSTDLVPVACAAAARSPRRVDQPAASEMSATPPSTAPTPAARARPSRSSSSARASSTVVSG